MSRTDVTLLTMAAVLVPDGSRERTAALFGGTLRRPLDWFDLVLHTAPLLPLLAKAVLFFRSPRVGPCPRLQIASSGPISVRWGFSPTRSEPYAQIAEMAGRPPPSHRNEYVFPLRTFMTSAGWKQARQVPLRRRTLG